MQGGSTITQQFVKNALAAQDDRTLFQKLREAALAYHLTHQWSKEKILNNYLNTIYFGNGAYGIEAAARTYFQPNHPGCDEPGDQKLRRRAAAAGGGAARRAWCRRRAAYDPIAHPEASHERAATSCCSGCSSRTSSRSRSTTSARRRSRCPTQGDLQPPAEDTRVPVLHLVDQAAGRRPARRRPAGRAAGVRGRPDASRPRSTASSSRPPRRRSTSGCPTATARAPRSWRSRTAPARSARWSAATTTTSGRSTSPPRASASPARRSSRSSSPRRCSRASRPNSVWASQKLEINVPHSKEIFTVNNYEGAYSGMHARSRAR